MMNFRRRLSCLTLALLLALTLACPAAAAESPVQDLTPWLADEGGLHTLPEIPYPTMLLADSAAYNIIVDETAFSSDTNASGTGWTYTASGNQLVLDGYQGGPITAAGALTLHTTGTVTITGSEGEHGISVSGDLVLEVLDGSLTVTGGSGTDQAGSAIFSRNKVSLTSHGITTLQGGNAAAESITGGQGIWGSDLISITGSGVTVTGGSNALGSGGFALFGQEVAVNADGTYTGGSGKYGTPSIGVSEKLRLGDQNVFTAVFQGGSYPDGSTAAPIYLKTNTSGSWDINGHLTLTGEDRLEVSPNQYTLTLNGGGGVNADGNASVTMKAEYPAEYNLSDYPFSLDGFVLAGWQTEDGTDVAADAAYVPEADTVLYAQWAHPAMEGLVWNPRNGKMTLSAEALSGVSVVICAAYDGGGKQTGVRYLPVAASAQSMDLPIGELTGETCRVFLLDQSYAPAGQAAGLKLNILQP